MGCGESKTLAVVQPISKEISGFVPSEPTRASNSPSPIEAVDHGSGAVLTDDENTTKFDPSTFLTSPKNQSSQNNIASPPQQPVEEFTRLIEGSLPNFNTTYTLGPNLGSGSFSTVKLGINKVSKQKVAVKCIKRKELPPDEILALSDEVSILKSVNHPNIIHMYDFYEDVKFFFLVMEVMEGGELFDRIVQKSYYNEREARDLVKTLLGTMAYLHDNNIVHRDLKPENLLLSSDDSDIDIRLADFGFAKRITSSTCVTQCGTPGYVAPEILKGNPYGLPVDMWSIGVITYILLGGYPPFHDENQVVLYKKIKNAEFTFHSEYWDPVSREAKDLIYGMLTVDPKHRITAQEAMSHPWISVSDVELESNNLEGTLGEIKKFNAKQKLVGTIKAVLAANKMKMLLKGLSEAGKEIRGEKNGLGVIQKEPEEVGEKDEDEKTREAEVAKAAEVVV